MKKIIGCIILLVLFVFSLLFSSFSTSVDLSLRLSPPSLEAPFGYDTLGRNLLERVASGTLVSFSISLPVALVSVACGTVIAYLMSLNGFLFSSLMVCCNSFKAIPATIIALFLLSLSGPGIIKLIVALSIAMVSNVARSLVSQIKAISSEAYIKTSEGFGIGKARIFTTHILPKLFPYLSEQFISVMLYAIIAESSLSYLGCGVEITTPSLGAILAELRPFFLNAPWTLAFPSTVLFLLGLSLSLISSAFSSKSEFDTTA